MITTVENMKNLRDAETRVTIGDSGTLTRIKHSDFSGYQKSDRKLHHVTLSDTSVIPG